MGVNFRVKATEFTDKLDMGIEKRKEARMTPGFWFSSNWLDSTGIYVGQTRVGELVGGEEEVNKRRTAKNSTLG